VLLLLLLLLLLLPSLGSSGVSPWRRNALYMAKTSACGYQGSIKAV
jgi:hypothetical protein